MPRDLVKLYSFVAGTRSISVDEQIPFKSSDVRLIINETKHEVICSSMQKENITVSGNVITFASKFSTLDLHDEITIEIDFRLSEIVPVVPESPTTHKVIFLDPFGVVNEQWVENGTNAIVPTPRVHDYLTFVEWNQSTENVTEDRVIGAIYDTTDGKTYAKIRLTIVSGLSIILCLSKTDSSTLTVDWGDNTQNTYTNAGDFKTGTHVYPTVGDYWIKVWISSGNGNYNLGQSAGTLSFVGGTTADQQMTLMNVYLANNILSIPTRAFADNKCMEVISISKNVTSIGVSSLINCYSLRYLILPNSVVSVGQAGIRFAYSLRWLSIPNSVRSYSFNTLSEGYGLKILNFNSPIPGGLCANCVALETVRLSVLVTSIGVLSFQYCYCVLKYIIYATTPPNLESTNAFQGISRQCKIYVPDASLTAYKTGTNWAYYAQYIYPLSDIGE